MANVDLITKKIMGAEPNTKTYYHEEGHLMFEELCSWGNKIRVAQDIGFKSLLYSVGLTFLLKPFWDIKWVATLIYLSILISFLTNSLSELYEEEWCNRYAKTKLGKKKDAEGIEKRQLSQV